MSRFTEEQIQQLIESGKSLPDMGSARQATEAKLYQNLFGELKKELPIQPGAHFLDRVMSRINRLESAPSQSVAYGYVWFWIGLSICLLGTILVLAPAEWIMTDLMSVLAALKPIKWGLLFGLLSLVLIQLLDFKLIREPSLPKLI